MRRPAQPIEACKYRVASNNAFEHTPCGLSPQGVRAKQEVKHLREAAVLRALRAAMVVTTMMLILMMFGRSFAMVRIA